MTEVLYYAVPFFVLLLVVEALSFRYGRDDDDHDLVGYEARDTRTSLTMGLGNVVINVGWKLVVVTAYAALYELTPLRIPADAWWAWVLLFVADDVSYYWFHRVSHENRVFWASHVVHHSSRHYNLSTALRQTWVPMTYFPFWLWLPLLGFAPWMVLLAQSWSLIYQFGLHTERIGRLPRPLEAVLNTPSHHRVHHGANPQYLDRNYGGILIVWDRLFGTYEPEGERVRYGLTTNLRTFNPVRVAFDEYVDLWHDVRRAPSWRLRGELLWHGPGWEPLVSSSGPRKLGSDQPLRAAGARDDVTGATLAPAERAP
jgi:sterol desaturase/sphingolipid hydroxylase (fatty acid hydroxylase superfamily)